MRVAVTFGGKVISHKNNRISLCKGLVVSKTRLEKVKAKYKNLRRQNSSGLSVSLLRRKFWFESRCFL